MIKAAFTLAIAAISVAPAAARTIYVSPSGADANTCLTSAKPCATIQGAMYKTLPGDVVTIGAGTYSKPVWISRGGTKTAKITYAFAAGARVASDPTDTKTAFTFDVAAPWVRVLNGEFVGSLQYFKYADALAAYTQGKAPKNMALNQYCIAVHASHVQIASNYVHDCSGAGIYAQDVDDVSISGNRVVRTGWWTSEDPSAIDIHYGKTPTDGEPVRGFTIVGNTVTDSANAIPFWSDPKGTLPTDGNGIMVDMLQGHQAAYAGHVVIQSNTVTRSGGSGIRAYKSTGADMVGNTVSDSGSCMVTGANCGNQNNGELNYNTAAGTMMTNIVTAPAGKRAAFLYASLKVVEHNNTFTGVVDMRGLTMSPTDILK
jgi:hypothetical protein